MVFGRERLLVYIFIIYFWSFRIYCRLYHIMDSLYNALEVIRHFEHGIKMRYLLTIGMVEKKGDRGHMIKESRDQ